MKEVGNRFFSFLLMHSFLSHFGILHGEKKKGVEKHVKEKREKKSAPGKLGKKIKSRMEK